jgi:hypothetical protein
VTSQPGSFQFFLHSEYMTAKNLHIKAQNRMKKDKVSSSSVTKNFPKQQKKG